MVRKPLFLILALALSAYADTGYRPPAVTVSNSGNSVKGAANEINFNSALTVTKTGTKFTVSVDSTTGNFIQTAPANSQTTAFQVSSGTIGTQLNLAQIRWNTINSMMLYKDGVTILSMPSAQDTFFGYNTNLINQGGVFNTSYGATAMPYPGTGNFNNAIGNSSMSGSILSGENNNAMGYASLGSLSSGFYNAAMGGSALNLLTTGTGNTAVGGYSLNRNVGGNYSTGVGYRALFMNLASFNTSIGYEASSGTDTSSGYTMININGTPNIYIGPNTGQSIPNDHTLNNVIAIGNAALVNRSNQAQIGGLPGSGSEVEVTASSFTSVGGWHQLTAKPKSWLSSNTPTATGQQYFCSDCATCLVAISTGNTQNGAFASMQAANRTTACN